MSVAPSIGRTHRPDLRLPNIRRFDVKSIIPILVTAVISGGVIGALAADRTIGQKGKVFSETEVAVKVGDTLIFSNDDNVAHNVISTTAGNEFNLGSQAPGASSPVTFKAAGDVKVVCAIHPRMQMNVKVEK
jgi:plastocyanin